MSRECERVPTGRSTNPVSSLLSFAGTTAVNVVRRVAERTPGNYPASTASAPVTASALSVTVFSSDGACTAMFSAKKRASAT
ncbi:hypothetical protein ACVILL_005009 [Bradyrhizobium sp. USDA 3364]